MKIRFLFSLAVLAVMACSRQELTPEPQATASDPVLHPSETQAPAKAIIRVTRELADQIEALSGKIMSLRNEASTMTSQVDALQPWTDLDIPLEQLAPTDASVYFAGYLPELEKLISESMPDMYLAHKDLYLAPPRCLGVTQLADSGVNLKFVVDVKEENIFVAQRALTRDIRVLFAEKGVEIPFPQVVVHKGD